MSRKHFAVRFARMLYRLLSYAQIILAWFFFKTHNVYSKQ